MLSGILTNDGFSAYVNGQTYNVVKSHPKYKELINALNKQDSKSFLSNIDVKECVKQYVSQNTSEVEIVGDQIFYNGELVNNVISNRIMEMINQGFDSKPMLNFLANLMKNPSFNSITQLYSFLEHNHLPITPDGCFLAYKAVRNDYLDKHSGKFSNKPGTVVSMPRGKVDDNPSNNCSYGFHVGTINYVEGFASGDDIKLLVKVNPADAVSVPSDHNASKLRVCKYEVVEHFKEPLKRAVHSTSNSSDYGYGDTIRFAYEGSEHLRYLYINEVTPTEVFGVLTEEDEKWTGNNDFRVFKRNKMSHVQTIVPFDGDEYDDEDNFEDDDEF